MDFIEELALITQADIAVSDDATGTGEKGGDWELEVHNGDIESSIPFTQTNLQGFSQILSYSGTINFSNVDYAGGPRYGAANANMDARLNVGSYIMVADGTSVRTNASFGSLESGIYNGAYESQLTLSFTNGEVFDVQSLYIYHLSYDPVYMGYRTFTLSSDQGHSYTIPTFDYWYGRTPTLNFTNITELRITVAESSGFYIFVDDMVVSNVRPPNTAPTLSNAPLDLVILEDTFSNVDLSAVTLADAESDPLTLTLTAGSGSFAAPADGAGVGSGVTEVFVNATTITLNGSPTDINTYLDTASNIQYKGPQDLSGDNAATITLSASDGTTTLASDPVVNMDITNVNDAPVATGVPSAVTLARTTTASVDLSSLTLSDVDSSDPDFTFTLTSAQGRLGAASAGNVSISGSGSQSLTLTGTVTDIDAYLNAAGRIQYTGMEDGQVTLTANDGDGSGTLVLGTIALNRSSDPLPSHIPILEEKPFQAYRPPTQPSKPEAPDMAAEDRPGEAPQLPPMMAAVADNEAPQAAVVLQAAESQSQQARVWVDSQGQVLFSQEAPLTAMADDIKIASVDIHPRTKEVTLVIQAEDPTVLTTLQVTLPDGSPLPGWLSYAPESGTFSGTPPQGTRSLTLQILHINADGPVRTLEVEIEFGANAQQAPSNGSAPLSREQNPALLEHHPALPGHHPTSPPTEPLNPEPQRLAVF